MPDSSGVTTAMRSASPLSTSARMRSASSCSASSQLTGSKTDCPAAALVVRRRCGPRKRSGLYSPCSAAWPRTQSAPWLPGWAGLPSILIALPSRVRTRVPHPFGHSPQTLAYQVATPGTTSSGGTTNGMMVSVGTGEQAPTAAAGAAPPSTLRKVRRPTVSVNALSSEDVSRTMRSSLRSRRLPMASSDTPGNRGKRCGRCGSRRTSPSTAIPPGRRCPCGRRRRDRQRSRCRRERAPCG